MNSKKIFKSAVVAMFVLAAASIASAQGSRIEISSAKKMDVALGSNLYCAGYVQIAPVNAGHDANRPNEIVGAYNEQDGYLYGQNKYLYINGGANKGVRVGDVFSVIRPRGEVNSRYTHKGRLGFYVQELGSVEVVRVQPEVSVVRVKNSCDTMMLGDLVEPFQPRSSAPFVQRPPLDLFGMPSGKAAGRIFLARDHQEALTRDQVIYVDLGAEDNVAPGDYLTIFRPLGKGNLFTKDVDETLSARDEGFQSDKYRGGKFSNQAPRKGGSEAGKHIVTTEDAKEDRPKGLRKVVGEGMVVNVRERTATVVITRVSQEIHTGDWVEIQ